MSRKAKNQKKVQKEQPQGPLKPEEMESLEQAFNDFDQEKTGKLDLKELKSAMLAREADSKYPQIFNLVGDLANGPFKDTDGKCEFPGFVEGIENRMNRKAKRKEINQIFKLICGEEDNVITIDTLKRINRELGDETPMKDLALMIERASADGNSEIDEEQFYSIMTRK